MDLNFGPEVGAVDPLQIMTGCDGEIFLGGGDGDHICTSFFHTEKKAKMVYLFLKIQTQEIRSSCVKAVINFKGSTFM